MTNELTFTTADFAALVGCTPRHLQQLARDGIIPTAARGRWSAASVTAYCAYLQSDARRGPADFQAERARLTRAQADLAEANLAQRQGELLARGDVDAAVVGAFARVRARLLAIPSKAAPLVAGQTTAEAGETIRQAIHEALRELSETSVSDLTRADAGGDG